LDDKKEETGERKRAVENVIEYLNKELGKLTEEIDNLMMSEIELVKALGERYSDVFIEKEALELQNKQLGIQLDGLTREYEIVFDRVAQQNGKLDELRSEREKSKDNCDKEEIRLQNRMAETADELS
jgi:hypothetical protein